ncbi:MAG TPA: RNA polymerase sigma-70 factor [Gemmatimonadaceae bacterium]|nr:RNA polymerase sigma-70 factor [Gemmatimonadaceae bacterium]
MLEDRELLARIREGDERAFDELFRRYYTGLVAFSSALLKGRQYSEDIVQDVLLELWRRREGLDIGDSCKAYLYRAVRNRALNEIRHENTVKRSEPIVLDEMPSSSAAPADVPVGAQELAAHIERAIAALPDPLRECFQLSRQGGLTYAEIAGVQQISVKTVEARMGRALKELRAALAEWL